MTALSNAPAPAETVREAVARAICANTTYTCEDPSCRCVTLMRIRADAVLAAIAAHGLALVPVEPTEAMLQAAHWAVDRWREKNASLQDPKPFATPAAKHACRWAAMLAAAKEGQS